MQNLLKISACFTILQYFMSLYVGMDVWRFRLKTEGWSLLMKLAKLVSLHNMTGNEQHKTSAYNSQSNGICEQQNRTIKDSLMKVLDGNPCDWPNIIEGVLFAHRVSKHTSTTFSPFFFMYNRDPTLPIDVKYSLVGIEGNESECPFDKETFDAMLTTAISMTANIHQTAGEKICSAQEKVVNFHLNDLTHSQFIRYQIRIFVPMEH